MYDSGLIYSTYGSYSLIGYMHRVFLRYVPVYGCVAFLDTMFSFLDKLPFLDLFPFLDVLTFTNIFQFLDMFLFLDMFGNSSFLDMFLFSDMYPFL